MIIYRSRSFHQTYLHVNAILLGSSNVSLNIDSSRQETSLAMTMHELLVNKGYQIAEEEVIEALSPYRLASGRLSMIDAVFTANKGSR